MQRIAIDMDEVVADTLGHLLTRYQEEFGVSVRADEIYGKRFMHVIDPAHVGRVREYFQMAEFFGTIPLMLGSQEAIRALMKRYEVFITTAAMDVPCSFTAKFEWLQRHFPSIPSSNIVFCGDKSIVAADFLIDDDVRHFQRFRGEGILYTAPHNVHETAYRRVNNWQDVRNLLLD